MNLQLKVSVKLNNTDYLEPECTVKSNEKKNSYILNGRLCCNKQANSIILHYVVSVALALKTNR